MVSVGDWKEAKCAATDDSDHIQAVRALASLLEDQVSPADAAKSITMTYAASLKFIGGSSKENLWYNNKLSEFWGIYMSDAIGRFGGAELQERLINLLVEISKQPDLEDDDGVVLTSIDHKIYWADLPGWNRHFSDDGLDYRYAREYFPEERDLYLAQIPHLVNATQFAAKLLQRGLFAIALPLEATCSLKAGLEHSYSKDSLTGLDVEESPLLIPAATTWLLGAGKTIYEHCLGDDTEDGWDRGEWNIQRWEQWKQQLAGFAERKDFNDECRSLAAQTVKKMVEVEEAHQF